MNKMLKRFWFNLLVPQRLNRMGQVIYFCNGEACLQKGGDELTVWMRERLRQTGLANQIHTVRTRCSGFCDHAPVLVVQPDNTWYGIVDTDAGELILQSHLKHGKIVENKLIEL